MHLLQAQPGVVADGSQAIDLAQSPADMVFLSAADTELSCLAQARARLASTEPGAVPSLRLANLMQLSHPMSVDLYVDTVVRASKLVIVRLLGGQSYWPYGVEQIVAACREDGVALALLPGSDQPDAELAALCSISASAGHRLWQFCVHGGLANANELLRYSSALLGREQEWLEPAPLARAGVYWPGAQLRNVEELRTVWKPGLPVAAIVFYRALVQAGDAAPVDALITALAGQRLNALPIFCASLKEPGSAELVAQLLSESDAAVVLNATGFAVATPGRPGEGPPSPLNVNGTPVLQVVFSGGSHSDWNEGTAGLSARDLAMNVALPEVDGRLLTRAVSFKATLRFDTDTQCQLVGHDPVPDRVEFVAALAARWVRLRRKSRGERALALVLANYPNKDGRLGNGVGLDTPAATVKVLQALTEAGYCVAGIPESGTALMRVLALGPTNAAAKGRTIRERLSLAAYQAEFATLPQSVQSSVTERWGEPHLDPSFLTDEGPGRGAFAIAALRFGSVWVAIQPARGYHIDPASSYHDPALVPPHAYLAFYIWLRGVADVDAIVHMGKHGNLEWLPGKALALSRDCFPEAALGPMPNLYPFIVNDPGEGTQAKRRAQAVIIDHLTPPMTRAESYGPLADIERLADEYYEAAGVDPRRLALLSKEILEIAARTGVDKDCGITLREAPDSALAKLDAYLCELKELQIRDGLHVFGQSPQGVQRDALLVALSRLPRGAGLGGDASILRALATDLELTGFDPIDCDMGAPWNGPRPAALAGVAEDDVWRLTGDTIERLELLSLALVSGQQVCEARWRCTRAVLDQIDGTLRPSVERCGDAEIGGLVAGLDGDFVLPGPAGAPTRGRPDVLPTGRNFYSIDTRTVPTPAAWQLGWHSATLLLERYRQEHGAWPRRLALSAWGTANMRTGGDDLAQALALLGVKPRWDNASRRVIGYEVMPLDLLDRPRVDVTLRISGFFRDAFPAQIDLFDAAVGAVAALEEPPASNPLAERVRADAQAMVAAGETQDNALRRASFRVFGSQPGAYGAGLQALMDERGWNDDADLARAYIAWGGYAYGAGTPGKAAHRLFEQRLADVELVLHNQDNREHDLLDSDDYYQFEGGLTATVRHLSGQQPTIYHNDHSRPHLPRISSLEEEIARVVRARVVNPKWIAGVMRHGYKGAFELAATVDYLFAFAATAHVVADHHFDAVFDAYLADDSVREFVAEHNPAALKEIAERLLEAQERALWRPRSNSTHVRLKELAGAI